MLSILIGTLKQYKKMGFLSKEEKFLWIYSSMIMLNLLMLPCLLYFKALDYLPNTSINLLIKLACIFLILFSGLLVYQLRLIKVNRKYNLIFHLGIFLTLIEFVCLIHMTGSLNSILYLLFLTHIIIIFFLLGIKNGIQAICESVILISLVLLLEYTDVLPYAPIVEWQLKTVFLLPGYIWGFIGLLAFNLTLIAFGFYSIRNYIRFQKNLLDEKEDTCRREKLFYMQSLNSLFPSTIAKELLDNGKVKSKYFNDASIMFIELTNLMNSTDITPVMQQKSFEFYWEEIAKRLQHYDNFLIKSIGGIGVCLSEINKENQYHILGIILSALEIKDWLISDNLVLPEKVLPCNDFRIGIHSGPILLAPSRPGDITLDVFGDSVKIANQIRHKAIPRQINISKETFDRIRPFFLIGKRRSNHPSSNNENNLYVVKSLRPEHCIDDKGIIPNKKMEEFKSESHKKMNFQLISA